MSSKFAWIAVVTFTVGAAITSGLKVLQHNDVVSARTEGLARFISLALCSGILSFIYLRASIDGRLKCLVIVGLFFVMSRSLLGFTEDVAAWRDVPVVGRNSVSRRTIEPIFTGLWIACACSAVFFALRSIEESQNQLSAKISQLENSEKHCRSANEKLRTTLDTLQKTQDELVRRERLRAVGELASGLAHDLNNALTPIVAYSQLLVQEDFGTQEDREDWKECIESASEDVIGLSRGLAAFHPSGIHGQTRCRTNLGQLVEQVIRMTRPKWQADAERRNIEIEFSQDVEQGVFVTIDPVDIRVALTNLIFNAVEAIHESGAVSICLVSDESHAILFVSNTGDGMSPSEADQCFEPFFTTKESGSGLGLAMCKRMIERCGGTIELVSTFPGETTFQIKIPLMDVRQDSRIGDLCESRKVLLIDDDPNILAALAATMRNVGVTVEVADNGSAALELFARGSFDLVITDFGMNGMTGREVLHEIRNSRPEQPVLVISGWSQAEVRSHFPVHEQPTAILQKPADMHAIQQYLNT